MSMVLDLTCELISKPSITPEDYGCQQLIADRLMSAGFQIEWFYCGEVSNVLITHGAASPRFFFLGHTDVVPPGPESDWVTPPFEPHERSGFLFGRGAADMKGSVAAMVVAMERFVEQHPEHQGQIGLLLTSDEEGEAIDGIRQVATMLEARDQVPDYCLVGEPSSQELLGDTLRIGRRGSIHGLLTVQGIQGHTAYPDKLVNPVHVLAPFMAELTGTEWDQGNEYFPPTSCQVSNISAGNGAGNVTPGSVQLQFNLRNAPVSSAEDIHQRIVTLLSDHNISDYTLDWNVSGRPFLTEPAELVSAVCESLEAVLRRAPTLDTGGGTSDGRFIAPLGSQVVELGPVNKSIHKVNEHVAVADLDHLMVVYFEVLRRILNQ